MLKKHTLFFFLLVFIFSACKKEKTFEENIQQIKHVVVIYMENHSFDNLYGGFEGANGLSNAKEENIIQLDKDGNVYDSLPAIPRNNDFPTNLKNGYFNIDQYVPSDKATPDVTHLYYHEQMQINDGKMNKFAAYNNSKGLAMGQYKTEDLPMYPYAKEYTLCDNFFHSGFGCSYFNHVYLIAADAAVWKDAPEDIVAELDSTGKMVKNGLVTPDGYVVNTVFSKYPPHPSKADTNHLLPPQTIPTIGDRLSEKDISWAWYSAGWDSAIAERPNNFAYNHEPFIYFENYKPGSEGREKHLKDENDFLEAAKEGTLPSVSFVKPGSGFDEHPGRPLLPGQKKGVELVEAVLQGPQADSTLIIYTYDENGGFWDHVAPPVIDRWGPGSRVPAILIGPFAKKDFVDTTQYETVSILSFIEHRWDLEPLTERDKNANPFRNALKF